MSEPTAPDIAVADYPQAIQWNWNQRTALLAAIADIDRRLHKADTEIERKRRELDTEIERRKREIDDLKGEHAKLGRERMGHVDNADLLEGLVGGWCQDNNVPLPPAPPAPKRVGARPNRLADLLVANGDPAAMQTREQPAVAPAGPDPYVPLPPNVIDSRADTTVPDAPADTAKAEED